MSQRTIDRLDQILSTVAAVGAIAFLFSTVSYGWYQTFVMMAR